MLEKVAWKNTKIESWIFAKPHNHRTAPRNSDRYTLNSWYNHKCEGQGRDISLTYHIFLFLNRSRIMKHSAFVQYCLLAKQSFPPHRPRTLGKFIEFPVHTDYNLCVLILIIKPSRIVLQLQNWVFPSFWGDSVGTVISPFCQSPQNAKLMV